MIKKRGFVRLFSNVIVLLLVATNLLAEPASETHQNELDLFVVHFSLGPNWDPTQQAYEQNGFAQHSENLSRMREAGDIVFGARYADLGMIVLKSASLEAAIADVSKDPGVMIGLFSVRVEPLSVFYDWQDAGPK